MGRPTVLLLLLLVMVMVMVTSLPSTLPAVSCSDDSLTLSDVASNTTNNVDWEHRNIRLKRQTRNRKNKKSNGNRSSRKNNNKTKSNRSQSSSGSNCLGTGMNWRSYQSYSTISRFLSCVASSSPLVTGYRAGRSLEGRDIMALKVSTGGDKPAIFIDGGIHAREWISPATVTGILHTIVENPARFSALLSKYDVYLMPLINPDGYQYSRTKDRLWRKNRAHKERGKCAGVDLNRNFSFKWGGRGSSGNTCSEEYRGQAAFSEPESRAVRSFVTARRDKIKLYLTFHSWGQMFLYPWGYDSRVVAKDKAELQRVGEVGAKAMGGGYKVGPAAQVNYEASGASDDWAKGAAGIKYSFTVELPDTGRYNFLLPPSRISGTVTAASRAVRAMAASLATSPRSTAS